MQRYRPFWLLVAVEMVLAAIVLAVHYLHLPLVCPFRWATGIPCPGCGGTRVLVLLLQGHLLDALMLNPLSVAVIIFAIVAPLWLFIDCHKGTQTLYNLFHRKWNKLTIIIIALIIAMNWIWNIYKQ
ncbi:MAG: DUF2752 domain-containing protein [Paludibacteraceae bacterium]|nr:DUF2752 domain-containing protein [Paludibacteraceae bacterium]